MTAEEARQIQETKMADLNEEQIKMDAHFEKFASDDIEMYIIPKIEESANQGNGRLNYFHPLWKISMREWHEKIWPYYDALELFNNVAPKIKRQLEAKGYTISDPRFSSEFIQNQGNHCGIRMTINW